MALVNAVEPDILGRAVEAGYLVQDGDSLRATRDGRLRLDALLAALVR
jgi:oxygen-independent coproporphyrinogen-3 oxidase